MVARQSRLSLDQIKSTKCFSGARAKREHLSRGFLFDDRCHAVNLGQHDGSETSRDGDGSKREHRAETREHD